MFEDSTFESAHRIHTRSRAWSVAALALNTLLLTALIAIPLIYPEALPQRMMNLLISAPPPPPPAPRPSEPPRAGSKFQGRPELIDMRLTVPTRIPATIRRITGPERPPGTFLSMDDDGGAAIPGGDPFAHASSAQPMVREQPKGPLHVSQGVAEGLLLQRVVPRYPPIALASRMQGTVVLQATISKAGAIEHLRVVSGAPMLQQAAIDAVSQWRYRPYLLNGQPVDVETTINVVFSLNH